ncbi:MAG: hypothetical protein FWC80_01040 [Firmicutes bacterium]|nr:hypothetical protein [Bacillota bacterium]
MILFSEWLVGGVGWGVFNLIRIIVVRAVEDARPYTIVRHRLAMGVAKVYGVGDDGNRPENMDFCSIYADDRHRPLRNAVLLWVSLYGMR